MSLCAFSITFAASATLILDALYVPALIIEPYILSIISATSSVEPEVIFRIVVSLFFLSPGFMRSGEYPQKKSLLKIRPCGKHKFVDRVYEEKLLKNFQKKIY